MRHVDVTSLCWVCAKVGGTADWLGDGSSIMKAMTKPRNNRCSVRHTWRLQLLAASIDVTATALNRQFST